ncbi:MAG: hypothetical protein R3279_04610 [Putridiphycobacter sp.]|nr:hypothetical protein [Putridiphycobacter sp.]
MKLLATLFLLSFTVVLNAQISVVEQKVKVLLTENGLYLTIPYGDKKIFEKALKDELKSWKGKVSTKDHFFADDCKLKEVGDNTFDAYAKVEDMTKGGVTMSVQIDLGGAYLNSKIHPAEYKVFEKKLYDFAVKTAKDVIEEEAKEQEKVQKDQEGELEDIKSEIEKQNDAITAAKKAIADAEDAIKSAKQDKAKKEEEIKETAAKIEAIRAKKQAVK